MKIIKSVINRARRHEYATVGENVEHRHCVCRVSIMHLVYRHFQATTH